MDAALLALLLGVAKPEKAEPAEPVRVCTEAPPPGERCEGEALPLELRR